MAKNCKVKNCNKPEQRASYCYFHSKTATVNRFLSNLYYGMQRRVNGKSTKRPDLYIGKPIMPKDVFLSWSKNHPDFLALYKRWVMSNFDRKMTPTLNRMNSTKGYTLNNVEWMTNAQNCGLAGSVRKIKAKREIYNLLGVNTNV